MAKNRTHNTESQPKRLARLQTNPIEAIETLLNSIDNFFNNEIRKTPDHFQTSLLFLGIHAAALTIGEVFFGNTGRDKDLNNYREFLKTFVDGATPDTTFSTVAEDVHNWRNILAHQWIGSLGHTIEYDYQAALGWEKKGGILVINPKIYCEQYLNAFTAGGKIWSYDAVFTPKQLTQIHTRIVEKYRRR
jgi:hypothetical protein